MAGGRPTKMTDLVVKKLEEAFALGCSDAEACLYADITKQTLYNYQDKYPEFIDRKEQLKETPIMLARQEVIKGLKGNPELALKYLERKRKAEFGTRIDITSDDRPINIALVEYADDKNQSNNTESLQRPTDEQI